MDDRALTGLMSELHAKLAKAHKITESDRELLKKLSVDIQGLLDHPSGTETHRQSVIAQLQQSITSFEASHPELTATMARMSKALSDMGI